MGIVIRWFGYVILGALALSFVADVWQWLGFA